MAVTTLKRKARKNRVTSDARNRSRKLGNLGTYAKAKTTEAPVETESN